VSSFDYPGEFVRMTYSNLMSTSLGLQTDIADPVGHARSGQRFLRPREPVFDFGAIARPLNDLLLESNAPKAIDFLSLDVEGAELEVLKGIDHEAFRFKYILVESRSLTDMQSYLDAHTYRLVESFSAHDYLFSSSGKQHAPATLDPVLRQPRAGAVSRSGVGSRSDRDRRPVL
jgi:hypothetical protein